jgi:hypothetical protein
MRRALEVARLWAAHGFPEALAGGYVILWKLKACGWDSALDRPQDYRPGALAVGSNGKIYEATRGTHQGGADQWTPVFEGAALAALRVVYVLRSDITGEYFNGVNFTGGRETAKELDGRPSEVGVIAAWGLHARILEEVRPA